MSLLQHIKPQLVPWLTAKRWVVAFSGGVDSVALLKLITELRDTLDTPPIVALHIEHGLQEVAQQWPAFCQSLAEQLQVGFVHHPITVDQTAPSLEQAARDARYQGFSAFLSAGDLLLTGHHQDDQAETVLFRAVRGAGVLGLAGMPQQRAIGQANLLRPLLAISKQQLIEYATQQQLDWVTDPSNLADDYDRNFLRNPVLPLLESRWPQAQANLARVATNLQQAQLLLDELAIEDLQQATVVNAPSWLNFPSVSLAALKQLSEARQKNALRYWLRAFTPMPDLAHWQGWLDLRDAAAYAQPIWQLATGQLLRYQDQIFWIAQAWLDAQPAAHSLTAQVTGHSQSDANGDWQLTLAEPLQGLSVGYRQGGESIQLAGRGRRDLKRLLQEVQLPTFLRGRIPLLLQDQQVLAVANFPQLTASNFSAVDFSWQPLVSDK